MVVLPAIAELRHKYCFPGVCISRGDCLHFCRVLFSFVSLVLESWNLGYDYCNTSRRGKLKAASTIRLYFMRHCQKLEVKKLGSILNDNIEEGGLTQPLLSGYDLYFILH